MKFRNMHYILQRPEDGDDGSGGDGGGGGEGGNQGGGGDQIAALQETMTGLAEGLRALATSQTQMQQQFTDALTKLAEGKGGKGGDDEEDDNPALDDTDLEQMPRKQFMDLIVKSVTASLKKDLQPITEQVSGLGNKLDETISKQSVEAFQKDHPDLMEWKAEIAAIFKAGRATTVADAYTLARSSDEEKTKKLEAKYNPPKKEEGATFHTFKGFPTGSGKTAKNTGMSSKQAAEAAWEDATANSPGLSEFLSTS